MLSGGVISSSSGSEDSFTSYNNSSPCPGAMLSANRLLNSWFASLNFLFIPRFVFEASLLTGVFLMRKPGLICSIWVNFVWASNEDASTLGGTYGSGGTYSSLASVASGTGSGSAGTVMGVAPMFFYSSRRCLQQSRPPRMKENGFLLFMLFTIEKGAREVAGPVFPLFGFSWSSWRHMVGCFQAIPWLFRWYSHIFWESLRVRRILLSISSFWFHLKSFNTTGSSFNCWIWLSVFASRSRGLTNPSFSTLSRKKDPHFPYSLLYKQQSL